MVISFIKAFAAHVQLFPVYQSIAQAVQVA